MSGGRLSNQALLELPRASGEDRVFRLSRRDRGGGRDSWWLDGGRATPRIAGGVSQRPSATTGKAPERRQRPNPWPKKTLTPSWHWSVSGFCCQGVDGGGGRRRTARRVRILSLLTERGADPRVRRVPAAGLFFQREDRLDQFLPFARRQCFDLLEKFNRAHLEGIIAA